MGGSCAGEGECGRCGGLLRSHGPGRGPPSLSQRGPRPSPIPPTSPAGKRGAHGMTPISAATSAPFHSGGVRWKLISSPTTSVCVSAQTSVTRALPSLPYPSPVWQRNWLPSMTLFCMGESKCRSGPGPKAAAVTLVTMWLVSPSGLSDVCRESGFPSFPCRPPVCTCSPERRGAVATREACPG